MAAGPDREGNPTGRPALRGDARSTAARWLAAAARTVLLAAALAVVTAAAVLLVLERSGRLTAWVREGLSRRLGEPVGIRSARWSWTDAAIEIEGLSLGPPAGAVELERVRVVWRNGRGGIPRPALLEVDGGRVVLSRELRDSLAARLASSRAEDAGAAVRLPAVVVRDVQLDLLHPGWGLLPIGSVRGAWTGGVDDEARFEGRLAPSLTAAGEAPSELFVRGRANEPGEVVLELSARAVPFSLEALPEESGLRALRRADPRGRLSLAASFSFRLAALGTASGRIRARLEDGSVRPSTSEEALQGLRFDLEAACAPGPGQDLASSAAWKARAQASGTWRNTRVDGWASWGDAADRGLRGRARVSARQLPFDPTTLRALGLEVALQTTWDALEPRGSCSLLAGLEWPRDGSMRALLEVSANGEAGVTFHGWPSPGSLRPQGFPMPVEQVHGRLLAVVDPDRRPEVQLALVGLRGVHDVSAPAERTAWLEGQVVAPPPGARLAEWMIRFGGQHIGVDGGGIPRGLAGLDGTEWIWPTFRPSGGEASFVASMRHTRDERSLLGRFDIDVADVGMTFAGAPLATSQLQGRLTLLFAPGFAWAAAFGAEGRTLTSDRVRVRGRLQQEPRSGTEPPPGGPLQDVWVEVENIALRGADRQSLARGFPEVDAALEQLAPSGKVDVRYRSSAAAGSDEIEFRAEVTPRTVQLSPKAFRVLTRDVRGRVLLSGRSARRAGGAGRGTDDPPFERVSTRLRPLVGAWSGDAVVACDVDLSARREARLFAAGVDPLNSALVGALREAFAAPGTGYAGLDLSALSVQGRVDLDGVLALDAAAGAPPTSSFRVHLRDNDFTIAPPSGEAEESGFGLNRLRGVVLQREGLLSGAGLRAQLGSTPVVLGEARFSLEGDAYHLSTRPLARGLPMDEEHLRFFLDPDTVAVLLRERDLRGSIDIEDALLELSGSTRAGGRVRFEGLVRPHAMSVDLGLPLEVDSAAVVIESLVFEGDHVRAWASVDSLEGRLAGRELRDTSLQLTYVEPRLSVLDLSGELEGGRLTHLGVGTRRGGPAFSIDLQPPFPFDLGLELDRVRVQGLVRGLFESEFASRGTLTGDLRLSGRLDRVTSLRGDGALSLRDSTLWSIPVMRALFSQLGFDDTAVFERMRTRFEVHDGRIDMSDIYVYSPLLQLVGAGRLDFEGRLRHELEVRYSLVDQLGPLNRLVYWIQNNLLRIAIRGDMARPRVELKGFLSLFQGGRERGRDLPLPPLAPLPARF